MQSKIMHEKTNISASNYASKYETILWDLHLTIACLQFCQYVIPQSQTYSTIVHSNIIKHMLNISINLGQLIRAKGLDLLAVIHLRFTRLVTWKTQKDGGNRWTFINWDPGNCTKYSLMYRVPYHIVLINCQWSVHFQNPRTGVWNIRLSSRPRSAVFASGQAFPWRIVIHWYTVHLWPASKSFKIRYQMV